jgi:hypothetical protein
MVKHGDVETPDLDVLGEYVSRLAGAGMPLFPTDDGELERELLRAANLPQGIADLAPDMFAQKEEMRAAAAENLASMGSGSDDDDDDES